MSFASLGLSKDLLMALAEQNFIKPFPIQEQAIPAILEKKDLLGIAKTGSGKTASYVLPILMNLKEKKNTKNRHINVLVLVPTRELASQVLEVFQMFNKSNSNNIKTMAVFGGVSINPQMKALNGTDILVATPGRLLDLFDSNALHLSDIDTLVLDEADKMLNLGFKNEMDLIFPLLPKKRQNILFSATLSDNVKNINQLILHEPLVIKIDEDKGLIDLINQEAYFISEDKKGPLLRYIIKNRKMKQVLVFTSSVKSAEHVANKLRNKKIDASAIHSKKSQGARNNLLTKFKHSKLRVLVATDLLARGIDIEFLPFVINYELPRSPKDYIHRIGRTGRVESPGDAISLITQAEQYHFKVIQKKMGKRVEWINIDNLDLKGY